MPRIPINVTKDAPPTNWGKFATTLLLVFVLGIFTGALSTQPSLSSQLSLIGGVADITRNLAGVGDAVVSSPDSSTSLEIDSTEGTPSLPSPTAQLAQENQENQENILTSDTLISVQQIDENGTSEIQEEPIAQSRAEVTLSIEERESTMLRLSREIARIKNSSVELIAEFNQNCGVWTADCATPFAGLLEKNNIAYNIAARDLDALTRAQ